MWLLLSYVNDTKQRDEQMKRYKLIQTCGANAELAEKIAAANNAGIYHYQRRGQKGEPKVVHNYVVMKELA